MHHSLERYSLYRYVLLVNHFYKYTYLKNYADFFAIFKDTTYTLSIIDPMIFDKFTYHIGLEVSKDQEYITRDDMKRNFNEFAERGDLPSLDDAFT